MAVRNNFSAAGAKDIPTIRRATNNALTSLASQINRDVSQLETQLAGVGAPTTGAELPETGVFGQEFYLTDEYIRLTDRQPASGFFGYSNFFDTAINDDGSLSNTGDTLWFESSPTNTSVEWRVAGETVSFSFNPSANANYDAAAGTFTNSTHVYFRGDNNTWVSDNRAFDIARAAYTTFDAGWYKYVDEDTFWVSI